MIRKFFVGGNWKCVRIFRRRCQRRQRLLFLLHDCICMPFFQTLLIRLTDCFDFCMQNGDRAKVAALVKSLNELPDLPSEQHVGKTRPLVCARMMPQPVATCVEPSNASRCARRGRHCTNDVAHCDGAGDRSRALPRCRSKLLERSGRVHWRNFVRLLFGVSARF